MDAVEEVTDARHVPPGGALQRQDDPRANEYRQCAQRQHAEDVDPGGDIRGLPVWATRKAA